MEVFLFWLIIIVLFLIFYTYYLIRKSPKGFRLQVKLTVIFFLLVLIPSITLTLIVSGLLNQSVEMSFLPGIEKSLSQSLKIIKMQMEDRGNRFLQRFPAGDGLSLQLLDENEICAVAQFKITDGVVQIKRKIGEQIKIPDRETVAQIMTGELTSIIRTSEKKHYCDVFKVGPDSSYQLVRFEIDEDVFLAKERISETLMVYTSLSLLKKSVLEGRLIWAMATVFIIILVLIAIYSARILSRGISGPIRELALGMQRVAQGELDARVEVTAKDELRILVDSFNKMATDLEQSQKKLVQAERLAAWRDVARRISHEIRNSLTPIQISIYRLQKKLQSHPNLKMDDSIEAIEDELESMRRVSEEFSQFARMPQITREKNDINKILENLVPLIEGGPKPIKIETEFDPEIPSLMVDRDQIKRALNNLLKNSLEASVIGGKICVRTVALKNDSHDVSIEIQDFGEGMDKETVAKIFEPYFTTKRRGMGLGLSIVKRIIEDHEGEIEINSEKGQGTRVVIRL